MNSTIIPIMSLCVAVLAVFFGPLVTMAISKRQIAASVRISEKQIISPIRQAWINELREIISELTAKSAHYVVAGFEDRQDKEYYRINELEHQLRLYLNLKEPDHSELLMRVRKMIQGINSNNLKEDEAFWDAHEKVMEIAQRILKREWQRVKNDI